MNWFTSDLHLGHANVIKYSNRPYESIELMDHDLIQRWNNRVKEADTVYFLGDFCFKKCTQAPEGKPFDYYRKQLNGSIVFIQGNHDKGNGFRPILQSGLIEYGGQQFYMVHKPEHMNLKYELGLCGHVHQAWKFKKIDDSILINVGVDQWNFEPIDIHRIMKALAQWKREHKV